MHAMRGTLVLVLLGIASAAAAMDGPGAGRIRDATYHYAPIGWSMPLPEGWRVQNAGEVERRNADTQARMEDALGGEIERTDTQLLHLTRDAGNAFTSAVQPPDPSMDYTAEQAEMIDAMLDFFRESGIRTRHTRHRERIDGVEFLRVDIVIVDADGRRTGLEQSVYDAKIGALGLTVSLTWNDPSARAELFRAWRASRFAAGASTD